MPKKSRKQKKQRKLQQHHEKKAQLKELQAQKKAQKSALSKPKTLAPIPASQVRTPDWVEREEDQVFFTIDELDLVVKEAHALEGTRHHQVLVHMLEKDGDRYQTCALIMRDLISMTEELTSEPLWMWQPAPDSDVEDMDSSGFIGLIDLLNELVDLFANASTRFVVRTRRTKEILRVQESLHTINMLSGIEDFMEEHTEEFEFHSKEEVLEKAQEVLSDPSRRLLLNVGYDIDEEEIPPHFDDDEGFEIVVGCMLSGERQALVSEYATLVDLDEIYSLSGTDLMEDIWVCSVPSLYIDGDEPNVTFHKGFTEAFERALTYQVGGRCFFALEDQDREEQEQHFERFGYNVLFSVLGALAEHIE